MLFRVGALPDKATDAAARFHAEVLPKLLAELEGGDGPLTLVFAPADFTHAGWRLAAVQGLAREHAPVRVNALVSDDERAIAEAGRYLAGAGGVTGQLLPLDGNGAGEVLSDSK